MNNVTDSAIWDRRVPGENDPSGNPTEASADGFPIDGVACRFQPRASKKYDSPAGGDLVVVGSVYCDDFVDGAVGDTVSIGGVGYDGVELRVTERIVRRVPLSETIAHVRYTVAVRKAGAA